MGIYQIAAVILCLTAAGGITLAIIRLRGEPQPPTSLAMIHGLAAATGVVLLVYAIVSLGASSQAKIALGVLVAAALGGSTLFLGFHRRNRPLPVPLVLGHGLIAAIGLALLLLAVF